MQSSIDLFQQAKQVIPGGVNSPVRSFASVGGQPIFIKSGEGAYITDEDGRSYIDYISSWGPLILGHCNPKVVQAVKHAVDNGLSFGAATQIEIRMAEKIRQIMPNLEMIRMVNSGTEATMSAIRLARAITKRDNIIKFAGCYHGHSDSLLVNAGSGALTFGVPSSPGIPQDFAKHTLVAEFNQLTSVEQLFSQNPDSIAAIIVEPIAGNMGCIPPTEGFLTGLRKLCDQHRALLIFDEVITGFRVHSGGAQALYNIQPDLTTLGKIIGGGMPVGAFAGSTALMEHVSPLGPVYQAGTLSGNPIAMAAGLTTLEQLDNSLYQQLETNTAMLTKGLLERAQAANISVCLNRVGCLFSLFFTEQTTVADYQSVMNCSQTAYQQFFQEMLSEGIYFGPSAFESAMLSGAHHETEITRTLDAAEKVFASMSKKSIV